MNAAGIFVVGFCCSALAAAPATAKSGDQVYEMACAKCHSSLFGSFLTEAPELGSPEWTFRLNKAGSVGNLALSVIKGKGGMPPRGGMPRLSDAEIRGAVEYMLRESKH